MSVKRCPDCGETKDISEFKYKTGDRVYGYCPPCRRTRARRYDAKRRQSEEEKYKRLVASRMRDNRAASKKWRENNPEYTTKAKQYRENNAVRLLAKGQSARAERHGDSGRLRLMDWDFVLGLVGEFCACSTDHEITKNNRITLDHIKPLVMGGTNCVHNIQPLCLSCNMKKGTSEIDFRTREVVERINEEYPECDVARGRTCCRTRFEHERGILIGNPEWSEDS